jgi:tripartite ATP-independent transporter DctP family solute receptor
MKRVFVVVLGVLVVLLWGSPSPAVDFTLKIGVVTPTDHPHSISSREFAKIVAERSKDRIKVNVFDSGKLGSNPELLDGVKTGILDMCVNTPGVMANFHPVTGLLELPYLFASKDHMMKVTRGPIAEEYTQKTGVFILGHFGGAQRNMITKSKKIDAMKDLSGLKMRTWEWNVMMNWWKALGAVPAVIPFPEVYTALQTGVIDGAENEFTTFTVSRWAEVCKFIALTQHNITVRPIMISKKKFDAMPADLQKILLQAAKDAADFDVKLEGELDDKNSAELKAKYGTVFTTPDKKPFIDKSIAVIKDFAKEKKLEGVTDKILALGK